MNMVRYRKRAFSLAELLVAIALLAALMALMLPAFQYMRGRSNQMRCQSSLRQVGMVLLNAVKEQGSTTGFWYSGSSGVMWNTMLVVNGYATHAELKAMSCPDIPYAAENGSVSGRHYGVYFGAPEGKIERYVDPAGNVGNVYTLPIRSHRSPAGALFLVDSATPAGAPSIRANTGSGTQTSLVGGGIHLRHQKSANLFFLDGHLEMSTPERLRELGVGQVLDKSFAIKSIGN